ncbi:gliding motility-associated C-terminal domain-containing protein [Flammeovirgaceae bacterium SG7u.111]|nr:gliding motility-associated C-terminal domain-containing protein [Flammeovirgaceae bacterium SG7u.132]WPO38682.1 gliding motility-associated C-terminal domain-containing protein [Flammeovirgaceae bacterium SG7u.111]
MIFLCALSFMEVRAQVGTEFWFVAPEVASAHGDRPIYLRLSTVDQPTRVRVSQPANPDFLPIIIELDSQSTSSIDLTSFVSDIENSPSNSVNAKGIFVTSLAPITAYYEVSHSNNPEIFPLKGENALGYEFYVPGQRLFHNQLGKNSIDIVATEDSTLVTIIPTNDLEGGRVANESFSIMLNKGETFAARAQGQSVYDKLLGTHIVASKKIAVTMSDDSIYNRGNYDLVGDQLVPIDFLGTEYIAVRGEAYDEVVMVMGVAEGTQYSVDGSTTKINLGKGESRQVVMSSNVLLIESNKPVYVYQLTGHRGEIGDAILPPINCTGSGQVGFVRSSSQDFNLVLLTQKENRNSFLLDGNPITLNFRAVPGTGDVWYYSSTDMSTQRLNLGAHLLTNTEGFFHMGILHELGLSSVYGYFSNYNTYSGSNVKLCPGGATVLDPGPQFDSYLWSTGSTDRFLEVKQEGTYTLMVTFDNCSATDTFNVFFAPTSVDLGPDTLFCEGESFLLKPQEFDTYDWGMLEDSTFNKNTPGVFAQKEGTYTVTVSNPCGTYTDTVSLVATPRPDLFLGNDLTICDDEELVLDAGEGFEWYDWGDEQNGQFLTVKESGLYKVRTKLGGCIQEDEIEVAFKKSPEEINLGKDRVVCVNEEITLTATGEDLEWFEWFDGSTDAEKVVMGEGNYWVKVSNECGEAEGQIMLTAIGNDGLSMANAFSPNNDAYNQYFEIDEWLLGSQIDIFSRWGDLIYQSESYQNDWDGGTEPNGLYFYLIKSECLSDTYKGWITLIR